MTTSNFIVRLLDKPYNCSVEFSEIGFNVTCNGLIVAEGYFTYSRNPEKALVFFAKPEIRLFEEDFKSKTVRAMRKEAGQWNKMMEYQWNKLSNR